MALGLLEPVIVDGTPPAIPKGQGPPPQVDPRIRGLLAQLAAPEPDGRAVAHLESMATEEIERLFKQAFKDRVYPRLFTVAATAIGESRLPDVVRRRHSKLRQRIEFGLRELESLREFGAANGIEYLWLKGGSMQALYPAGYQRYWWDLDIGVQHEESLWQTLSFLRNRGYEWPYPGVAAVDCVGRDFVAQFKSFTTVPQTGLPFAVELTLGAIQTGWQTGLRLETVRRSGTSAGRGVALTSPRAGLLVLLAECVEREEIRVRDVIDWNVGAAQLDAAARAGLDRDVRAHHLGYVVARIDAARRALEDSASVPRSRRWDGSSLQRLAVHERGRSAAALPRRAPRLWISMARELMFASAQRRRFLGPLVRADSVLRPRTLCERGTWIYLVPLGSEHAAAARRWSTDGDRRLLASPSGVFLASTTAVLTKGDFERAQDLARGRAWR